MQILRWLRKPPQGHSGVATTRGRAKRESGDELKPRDPQRSKEEEEEEEEDEDESKRTFTILLRREDSRTRFYRRLHRMHLRSLHYYKDRDLRHPVNSEQRMGRKAESASVGWKVLPICDAASTSSDGGDNSDGSEEDVRKGEPKKAISRMKEVLRWTAAAEFHKVGSKGWKALCLRDRVALKAQVDGSSSTYSKISFRRDAASCSTSLSVHAPLSMSRNDQKLVRNPSKPSANHYLQGSECGANKLVSPKTGDNVRAGNWITSDSDFVVLEL